MQAASMALSKILAFTEYESQITGSPWSAGRLAALGTWGEQRGEEMRAALGRGDDDDSTERRIN